MMGPITPESVRPRDLEEMTWSEMSDADLERQCEELECEIDEIRRQLAAHRSGEYVRDDGWLPRAEGAIRYFKSDQRMVKAEMRAREKERQQAVEVARAIACPNSIVLAEEKKVEAERLKTERVAEQAEIFRLAREAKDERIRKHAARDLIRTQRFCDFAKETLPREVVLAIWERVNAEEAEREARK